MCHNSKIIVFDIIILGNLVKPNYCFISYPKFNKSKIYLNDEIYDSSITCLPFNNKLSIYMPCDVKDYQIYLDNIVAKCSKCNFYTNFYDKKCACEDNQFFLIELSSIRKVNFSTEKIFDSNLVIKNIFSNY